MYPTPHFERNHFRRLSHRIVLWIACTSGQISGQSAPIRDPCVDLNKTAMAQVASGKLKEAELTVNALLTSGADQSQTACAGLVLSNMAVFLSISGRSADGARLAEQSVQALEKTYSSDDPRLLRPLQVLASTSFDRDMLGKAREAFKRMQAIRIQRPKDRALLHGIAAALSQAEGRLPDAETDYFAALQAWQDAGRGESADTASVLAGLGSLYMKENRLSEAGQVLDRAFAILNTAKDAVSMDRTKLLQLRGVLQARQGDWQGAEQCLHDALAMADREPWVDPFALRSILNDYAAVLRRNNRGREARSIEQRAAGIPMGGLPGTVVDITGLLPKVKPSKK
jgi:tetratricopeptide (TPR) repeat protein